jgi:hypothetical protein
MHDTVQLNLIEIMYEIGDWINLEQDMDEYWAVVKDVLNPWVPQNAESLMEILGITRFPRGTLLHEVRRDFFGFSTQNL